LNVFTEKLKEVLLSVIPIVVIVLILNFTLTPLETPLLVRFGIGSIFIILGLAVFLIGVDIGITPLANLIGSSIAKINKLWLVIIAGLILGFFVCIAEPDLLVFANQVDLVTSGQTSSTTIILAVSIGLAIMLSFGLVRIVYNMPLYKILTILYLIIFLIALFTDPAFLAIAFDASGATTGALAVPFILALSLGVSTLKKDSKSSEKDSFGLVAIASIGAILSVMI
jgi:type IV secretory pathway VirB3-like protein